PRHAPPALWRDKLREEGTTYRTVLDELRQETALHYLERQDVPTVDVAFLLGFSEQSAFNHAFRRWTGTSPQQYRMQKR
ncbi:MAG: helix-turn-helix domain-containing protein, partial [Anaerolineae bacterium]